MHSAMVSHVSSHFQYLEEVLDALRVVAVALPADALHLFDLAGLACGLDVFEVHFRVLTEVHNGPQEIEETYDTILAE